MTESFLLYQNCSTDGKKAYHSRRDITKDLNLDIVFRTMAKEDSLIYEKVSKVMMIPLHSPEEICYRQEIIQDFSNHPKLLERMYECAKRQETELNKFKQKRQMNLTRSHSKVGEMLETLAYLTQGQRDQIALYELLGDYEGRLSCEGLIGFYRRLGDEPLSQMGEKLEELQYFVSGGVQTYSFRLGGGMKIEQVCLNDCAKEKRRLPKEGTGKLRNLIQNWKKNTMSTTNHAALKEDIEHLTEVTMETIVKMFGGYLEQMMRFYEHFVEEISFYMGAVRFIKRFKEIGLPLCRPVPGPTGTGTVLAEGLYELSMAIYTQTKPVDNRISLCENKLTLITGANQGGKSTFLRSYGIAQVLMQCGMPVAADRFEAPIYHQIFTHFTRRESEKLDSGRLKEELKRMSDMIEATVPDSLFLLNESFASTTEKEGANIARGILRAFYEKGIVTFMVTHLYQLANELYEQKPVNVTFLTAQRLESGERTFRMIPGRPTSTSYGTDLFRALEEELKS